MRSGESHLSVQCPNSRPLGQMTGTGRTGTTSVICPYAKKIFLAMPPAPGSDNRSETTMEIFFTNYQIAPPLLASVPWLQSLHSLDCTPKPPKASTAAINFSAIAFANCRILAALIRPESPTATVITLVVVVCIVITPTLQACARQRRWIATASGNLCDKTGKVTLVRANCQMHARRRWQPNPISPKPQSPVCQRRRLPPCQPQRIRMATV
ncbi:MAG: hypothetical protein U0175_35730 [Caldilineaceae bacterium]